MVERIDIPFCRVCKHGLGTLYDRRTGRVSEYRHLRQDADDHVPDPVALADFPEGRIRCDFCSQYVTEALVYRTVNVINEASLVTQRTYDIGDYRDRHTAAVTRAVRTARMVPDEMGEDWSACVECAELIDKRDIRELVWRVSRLLPPRLRRPNVIAGSRAEILRVYEQVFPSLSDQPPARLRAGSNVVP